MPSGSRLFYLVALTAATAREVTEAIAAVVSFLNGPGTTIADLPAENRAADTDVDDRALPFEQAGQRGAGRPHDRGCSEAPRRRQVPRRCAQDRVSATVHAAGRRCGWHR